MKASAVHILTDGYPLASESWPAALPFSCHDLFLFTHLVVWPISFQKNYFITLIRQHTERCLHELGYVIKRGKSPFKSLNLPAGRMSKQKKKMKRVSNPPFLALGLVSFSPLPSLIGGRSLGVYTNCSPAGSSASRNFYNWLG